MGDVGGVGDGTGVGVLGDSNGVSGFITTLQVVKKIEYAFPARSSDAIRMRWYTISKELWTISEDKQLIYIVNGAHFKTRDDMNAYLESSPVSIADKTINQCIEHWCKYHMAHTYLNFHNSFNTHIRTLHCFLTFYFLLVQ